MRNHLILLNVKVIILEGVFVSLSYLVNFLIRLSTYFSFPETFNVLSSGTYFYKLGTFLIFTILFFLGVRLPCVIIFDDSGREDFGEKMPRSDLKC